MHYVLSCMWTN